MKRTIMLAFVTLVALTAPAIAGVQPGPPGSKIEVWVPDGWAVDKQAKDGEGVLVALEPAGDAMLLFALADAANADKAINSVKGLLGQFITSIKLGKASKTTLNGMAARTVKGSGKIDGKKVTIAVAIVQTPTDQVLIGVGVVQKAKEKAHKATLKKVLAGIKPTP
jgi:hypothetical protein